MKADKELLERMVGAIEDATDLILQLWHNHEAQAEAIRSCDNPKNLVAIDGETVLGLLADLRVTQLHCKSDLNDIAFEETHR